MKINDISIIMVDGSFREKFHSISYFAEQTIPANRYELIWVEYFNHVTPELESEISQHDNFKIIKLNKTDEYHSSYCFNEGIKQSSGDLIVIPDADVVVENDFLEKVYAEHQKNEKLVMYIYRYNEPEDQHKEQINIEHLNDTCILTNPSNYGGCLTVRKKWLMEINGYEQHPVFSGGFHANGYDVYTRLKSLGLHIMWHPELKLYHPWHPLTLVNSDNFDKQKIISDYRAKKLIYKAAQGIDSSSNSYLPGESQILLDKEKSNNKSSRKLKDFFKIFS